MLGVMVITWAWAENALALCIGIIDEKIGAVRGHKVLPLMLNKRVSYLRTALADIAMLEPLKDSGNLLAERFMDLAPRRNNLVHGSVWTMPHDAFETLHLSARARKYAGEQKGLHIGDVVAFNAEVKDLADFATAFLRRLGELLRI